MPFGEVAAGESLPSRCAMTRMARKQTGRQYMLVLSRKRDQVIQIGGQIEIKIVDVKSGSVRLAISAPKEIRILRGELEKQDCLSAAAAIECCGPLRIARLGKAAVPGCISKPLRSPGRWQRQCESRSLFKGFATDRRDNHRRHAVCAMGRSKAGIVVRRVG